MTGATDAQKPDFRNGFPLRDLADGCLVSGRAADDDILLVRHGEELFAVGAHCTHYGGPLANGLVVGDTVRCPWHHACFNLRTGEALRAPALDSIPRWQVERVGDTAFVREKLAEPSPKHASPTAKLRHPPASIVIIGGGGAGLAAAEMLRREGYDGALTMISGDDSPPCDRPNLSKDFLAGTAQEDWIPLRQPQFYTEQRVELVLNSWVAALDLHKKQVQIEKGKTYGFDALLIATGAAPVRLEIPGAASTHIHYLRTFADSRAIVAKAASAKRVVVVGASFIGLEVAASLRTRGIDVDVVAPESQPLERVMGREIGGFIREVHEAHGVTFHLGQTVSHIEGHTVTLKNGESLDADFVVLGVGVRPSLSIAERAGLAVDRGIAVNEYLETSTPGVFAAGDVARWLDPHSGDRIRVEHWVVAQRQGQVAARNMLGYRERFDAVPFFWSQHYDIVINYIGHAESWDAIEIDGKLDARDCAVSYKRASRTLAMATISRDLKNLQIERAMESRQPAGLGAASR